MTKKIEFTRDTELFTEEIILVDWLYARIKHSLFDFISFDEHLFLIM